MIKKITAALTAILLCMQAGAQNIQIDSLKPVTTLDEVIVTYNKWERKLNEVPNRISKIVIRDARLKNSQTMADLLGATGEVFIQKSQGGGGSPMIRGFATNRILMVVDGVRMNNAIYRSGNIQNVISLDPLALADAEIIFGPGSLIYGSDAIGGVMDFHTLEPKFSSAKNKTIVKGSGLVRYATANTEKTAHADVNMGSDKFSFLSSFSFSDFGDTRMGIHGGDASYLRPQYVQRVNDKDSVFINTDPRVQKFSGYTQKNFINKIRFKPTDNLDIQYGFHYSVTGNIPRYDRLIEYAGGKLRFAEWYYGPQLWRMHALQVYYRKKNPFFDQLKFVTAYQDYEESRYDRRRNNNFLRSQVEKVGAFSANADFNKEINNKQELFYGIEFIQNKVGSSAFNTQIVTGQQIPTATRYPDGSSWLSYAAYISCKNNLSERISVVGGLRYNRTSSQAKFDTTFFKFPFTSATNSSGSFTGNVGFVYRPSNNWQLNFNFSTGFRTPNIDDIGKVFESAPGIVVVPNPDLGAEYAYNSEIGVVHGVGQDYQFYFSAFYTVLNNALTRRPFRFNGKDSMLYDGSISAVEAIQNVATATVWGIQTGWEIRFAKLFIWETKLNRIQGKETDDIKNIQVPLRHAPPFYGSTAIKCRTKNIEVALEVVHNSVISNANLAPSEQAKTFIYAKDVNGKPYSPAWSTLNFKAAYSLTGLPLQFNVGWENITNTRYRPYSSGLVAAGSNFIFSMRVMF